ncbi:ankyrin repeat domain-containing protein [Novosphingobium bradum]|uniref:Ankyrin repeat domain-containing protein n=1 Tax=Novosphingobium bradum TaxID=1737444 RepID=A0ABV7IP62_9SPHN
MRFGKLLGMRIAGALAGLAMAGAAALVPAAPAQAQFMGAGFKFLEAVKKKDGEAVEKAVGETPTIVNTRDVSTGDTPLHLVTQGRELTWLNFLLYKGANPNLRNDRGVAPLGLAVSLGWAEGVELLLAKGARVNDPDGTGETPLIAAVHQRSLDLVKLLVKAGADPLRADNSGRSARDYAELMGKDSAIWTEIEAATKAAAARRKQSYGPSF